ncbi:phage tail domain-containing protein [Lachnoclostridium sp. Marseille-P6806]|uniref:phage tail domain-containing protein n=1 Tax=Lachnoclostridium sp. Marseille-P6806 TaxID=2364793 RepID=UPI00102F8F38|nr:phage tail domain-containing protein [Lachnoclostridium sp. Marseille-P6806]
MIKSINVKNFKGESTDLVMGGPGDSGLFVTNITGLAPTDATINMIDLVTSDGSFFNSARLGSRQIVITCLYQSIPDGEQARKASYKYFPVKKQVTLTFNTDKVVASITGYVEKNEATVFDQLSSCQITIDCPDPYFYDAGAKKELITYFAGIEPRFEFPFSNESLAENLIEFGAYKHADRAVIVYEGDASIGIKMYMHAIEDIDDTGKIRVYNVDTDERFILDCAKLKAVTGAGFSKSDDIEFSTERGNKHVWLIRNGRRTNILNCINRDASWFEISRGPNIFSFLSDKNWQYIQFYIKSKTRYEGI